MCGDWMTKVEENEAGAMKIEENETGVTEVEENETGGEQKG